MIRRTITALCLALVSAAALAFSCPKEMAAIDQALESGQHAELGDAELERVRALRAEGERLHQAGEHEASLEALEEAKALLGV